MYTINKCRNKDCNNKAYIPNWFKPFAEYCDDCRPYAIEQYADDAREEQVNVE